MIIKSLFNFLSKKLQPSFQLFSLRVLGNILELLSGILNQDFFVVMPYSQIPFLPNPKQFSQHPQPPPKRIYRLSSNPIQITIPNALNLCSELEEIIKMGHGDLVYVAASIPWASVYEHHDMISFYTMFGEKMHVPLTFLNLCCRSGSAA